METKGHTRLCTAADQAVDEPLDLFLAWGFGCQSELTAGHRLFFKKQDGKTTPCSNPSRFHTGGARPQNDDQATVTILLTGGCACFIAGFRVHGTADVSHLPILCQTAHTGNTGQNFCITTTQGFFCPAWICQMAAHGADKIQHTVTQEPLGIGRLPNHRHAQNGNGNHSLHRLGQMLSPSLRIVHRLHTLAELAVGAGSRSIDGIDTPRL